LLDGGGAPIIPFEKGQRKEDVAKRHHARLKKLQGKEWRSLLARSFEIKDLFVLGHKSQIIPLPQGQAKQLVMGLIPNTLGRLVTNRPSMGYLLVSSFRKRDDN